MENKTSIKRIIIIALFLATILFVSSAYAATSIDNSFTNNVNVYGSSGYYDISSTTSITDSRAINPVHNSGEYVNVISVSHFPETPSVNNNVGFTINGLRGSTAYLSGSNALYDNFSMNYGTDGSQVGSNVFTAKYTSAGSKTPTLSINAYDGTKTVNVGSFNVVSSVITSTTIDDCITNNVNVYGTNGQYDISSSSLVTDSTAINSVHNSGEYLNVNSISHFPDKPVVNNNVAFTMNGLRGSTAYLSGNNVLYDSFSMNYGTDGSQVGSNVFTGKYTSSGVKNPVLSITGYDGVKTVNANSVEVIPAVVTSTTIDDCVTSNVNVYGRNGQYDISSSSHVSDSRAIGSVHNANEYLNVNSISHFPETPVVNNNVAFTINGLRGSTAYLSSDNVLYDSLSMNYGSGGTQVGGNIFTAKYSSTGTKNPTLSIVGYDGTKTVNAGSFNVISSVQTSVVKSDCDLDESNVYGSNGQVITETGVTSTNVTTKSNTYLAFNNVAFNPENYSFINETVELSYTEIGSSVSLNGNLIVINDATIDYGQDGQQLEDIFHFKYSTYGNKTITISNVGWKVSEPITVTSTHNYNIYDRYPVIVKQTSISETSTVGTLTELKGSQNKTIWLNVGVEEFEELEYTYKWYDNDVLIEDATTSHPTITIADSSTSIVEHTYYAKISNGLNEITSNSVKYYAFPKPQSYSVQVSNQNFLEHTDGSTQFSINTVPVVPLTDTYTFKWILATSSSETQLYSTTNPNSITYVYDRISQLSHNNYQVKLVITSAITGETTTSTSTLNIYDASATFTTVNPIQSDVGRTNVRLESTVFAGGNYIATYQCSYDDTESWTDLYSQNFNSGTQSFVYNWNDDREIGNYNLRVKIVLQNGLGELLSNVKVFEQYSMPVIEDLILTPDSEGVLSTTLRMSLPINPENNDNIHYQWQTKESSSTTWADITASGASGNVNRDATVINYNHAFSVDYLSDWDFRVVITVPSKYPDSIYSSVVTFNAYRNPYNLQIEQSGFVFNGFDASATFVGFEANSIYDFQYSTDNITWNSFVETRGNIPSKSEIVIHKIVSFKESGDYYVRAIAIQKGNVYASTPVSILVADLPSVIIDVSSSSEQISVGDTVTFSGTSQISGLSSISSYQWQYSSNDETWTNIASATSSSLASFTYTFNNLGGVYFRLVVVDDLMGEIYSNVDGRITNTVQPQIVASGLGTASADEYIIAVKTIVPFDIVKTYAISSNYGLIVTKYGAYIIDGTLTTWEDKTVIASEYFTKGIVTDCKYLNGHLIAKTINGDVFVQNVFTNSFGEIQDLRGFQSADIIDISRFKFLVADIGVGAYVYNFDGSVDAFIPDIVNDVFAITHVSSDGGQSVGVIAGSSSSNVLRAYSYNGDYTTFTVNGNKIISISGLNDQTPKLIVTTDVATAFVSYSLTPLEFVLNGASYANLVLTSPDSSYSGNLISGGSESNFVLVDNNGYPVVNFPTISKIIQTRLARSSENLAICGGNSGEIYILNNGANGWGGLQSFGINTKVVSLGMSDEGYLILAANNNEVYSGIHLKQENQGEIVTTLYYMTVSVYDENGLPMKNAQFRVTSEKGSSLYSTDAQGTRTIQVIPTYEYIFALPNGEDSVTLVANNYALQYVSLQYPKVNVLEGVVYNAKLNENRYIKLNFNDKKAQMFNLSVEIKDDTKTVKYQYNALTNTYEYIFDTQISSPNSKYFYVSMSGSYEGKEFKDSWVFEIKKYDDGAGGTTTDPNIGKGVVLGDIPFLPSELGENWTTFLFGGLIMIIGGLFGYAHSAKGCVLMVIIAAVLTFVFHVLPINPIWMGCMVILGFLAIYSWASQNEGN